MTRTEEQRADDLAAEVIRDFERMSGTRGTLESSWRQIAERIYPSGTQTFSPTAQTQIQGDRRTDKILDSTAVIALQRFSAILDSLLTPQNKTWHRLKVNNRALAKNRQVQLYFDEVTRVLFDYRYAPRGNYVSQNQKTFKSLGAYGTGGLFIDDLYGEPGLRYKSVHIGQLFIDENHQGLIDKVIRAFFMTARQAKQKWGDKLPERIRTAAEKSPDDQFLFLHRVCPRTDDYDPNRKDYRGMKFESCYVALDGKKLLQEGGFNTFPYAISRYEQDDNGPYGLSPASEVLPAIKTLNEQKRIVLRAGHKAIDPSLIMHDDGIMAGFSVAAGAMNPGGVTADGRPLVHALPVGNVGIGKELMDDERAVINDAFLVNLFQILMESPQMSATEVMERAKEKGILMAPTMGRQSSEYLGPKIEREIDVLARLGKLPPMPPVLLEARGEYTIEYDSPLTRAARAEEAAGVMRSIESALQVVNVTQNPEPLDFFDWDIIIPEISAIQGVPTRWMRGLDAVQQIRAGRAQQAQVQNAIQAGPSVAAVLKAGSQAQKTG